MENNKGFITIMSLMIMTIILLSALFLIHTSNLEYQIVNSSKNSIQSYYIAESKIYMALNKEKYYYNQLLPRIEWYIKYNRLGPMYDAKIRLDINDLIEEDRNDIVNIDFFVEDERRILELNTSSSYQGIAKTVTTKMTLFNDLYEMGIPIISRDSIDEDKIDKLNNYMLHLQEKIEIPSIEEDIVEVPVIDYEEVNVVKEANGKISIEFFRNDIKNPVKKETMIGEKIFLLAQNSNLEPTISIISENSLDKIILEGILYVEGNLNIYNDFEFNGIIIINKGELFIDSSAEVKVEGIVFLNNLVEEIKLDEDFETIYNFDNIKKYGIYLPGFIDLKTKLIKNN